MGVEDLNCLHACNPGFVMLARPNDRLDQFLVASMAAAPVIFLTADIFDSQCGVIWHQLGYLVSKEALGRS